MLDGAVGLWVGRTEDLQRLVFGCRGEGEIAGVWQQLARFHQAVDLILEGLLFARFARLGERLGHCRAGAAALAGMGLVDDDGEPAATLLVTDLVKDVWERLHR